MLIGFVDKDRFCRTALLLRLRKRRVAHARRKERGMSLNLTGLPVCDAPCGCIRRAAEYSTPAPALPVPPRRDRVSTAGTGFVNKRSMPGHNAASSIPGSAHTLARSATSREEFAASPELSMFPAGAHETAGEAPALPVPPRRDRVSTAGTGFVNKPDRHE